MIKRHPSSFPESFLVFYPFMKEIFLKNNETILKYLETKVDTPPVKLKTGLYMMQASIDYKKLYNNYLECVQDIQK
jgi:hypothetical protein